MSRMVRGAFGPGLLFAYPEESVDRCPHAGDPLSEGALDGPIVTCAAHGRRFDVPTGFRPEDGFPIPRFPVRVVERFVEEDAEAPLDLPPRGRHPAVE